MARRSTQKKAGAGGGSPTGHWTCARLWLRVQADAFRFDPLGYLQGVGWRLRRLKLRSRNRLSALAGRSPHAYAFWTACREPLLAGAEAASEGLRVVPVVDCTKGRDGLARTIGSLPSGCQPLLVGAPAIGGGSVASPSGLAAAIPDFPVWICPIECGDRLAPGALGAYAEAAATAGDARIVYADDDLADDGAGRREPHFKPDWNPDLFEHHDFIAGSSILRVERADLTGLPAEDWVGALTHRLAAMGQAPAHLHRILHHRHSRPAPIVPGKPEPLSAADAPPVTIIVPTRNGASLLRTVLDGVGKTDYPAVEVIVVDNGSDEPEALGLLGELKRSGTTVIEAPGPFNYSRLNNLAVGQASGELLCFLNNDVEMLEPDWLALLVRQAVRDDIGAAGARLLYPDGSIQHAGVFTGIGGGAAHAHRFERAEGPSYFERSRLPQRVSAVTGACMVVAKDKFLAVGGFDEDDFPVAFNDVDLCLKLNRRGWQSFYEPRATLIHHESKSRGSDRLKANRGRFAEELAALKRKWGTDLAPDPFHHPNLSPFCEQFLIGL